MNMETVSMILLTVIFAFLFKGTSAQLPSTLCPNNFRYEYSGNNFIGVVTLQKFTTKHGHTTLKIEMEQPEISKLDYKGKISLLNIDEKSEGQPLTYRLDFPLQNAVPRVIGITVNNVRICGFQKDSSSKATFYLTHTIDSSASKPEPRAGRKVRSPTSPNSNDINAVCGRDTTGDNTNFILRGEDIAESQYPWIVAIFLWNDTRNNWEYKCGGSLVSTKTVITAAHCFYNNQSQMVQVSKVLLVMGRNRLDQWKSGINVFLERIVIHPDYRPSQYDGDIAILHLKNSVTFTTTIGPVCLWEGSSDIIDGSEGIVIGWGRFDTVNFYSNVPKLVDVVIRSCSRKDVGPSGPTGRLLCGGLGNGKGPCFGDSGSGLVVYNDHKWILRGVVNSGNEFLNRMCNTYRNTVYADTAKYTGWINSNLLL